MFDGVLSVAFMRQVHANVKWMMLMMMHTHAHTLFFFNPVLAQIMRSNTSEVKHNVHLDTHTHTRDAFSSWLNFAATQSYPAHQKKMQPIET